MHFRASPRITPIVAIASEGWTIASRADAARPPGQGRLASRGAHGYDNAAPSMRGILIAAGPAFRRGAVMPPVESVHLYALMCRILGLTPAANDGSAAAMRLLLASPRTAENHAALVFVTSDTDAH